MHRPTRTRRAGRTAHGRTRSRRAARPTAGKTRSRPLEDWTPARRRSRSRRRSRIDGPWTRLRHDHAARRRSSHNGRSLYRCRSRFGHRFWRNRLRRRRRRRGRRTRRIGDDHTGRSRHNDRSLGRSFPQDAWRRRSDGHMRPVRPRIGGRTRTWIDSRTNRRSGRRRRYDPRTLIREGHDAAWSWSCWSAGNRSRRRRRGLRGWDRLGHHGRWRLCGRNGSRHGHHCRGYGGGLGCCGSCSGSRRYRRLRRRSNCGSRHHRPRCRSYRHRPSDKGRRTRSRSCSHLSRARRYNGRGLPARPTVLGSLPLENRAHRVPGLRGIRQIELRPVVRRLAPGRDPGPIALEVRTHTRGLILVNRGGVRLAGDANRLQRIENRPALHFQFACQIVDSNFGHPSLCLPVQSA